MVREDILITLISVGLLILIATQAALFLSLRMVARKVEKLIDSGQTVVNNAAAFTRALPIPAKAGVPLTSLAFFLYRKIKGKKKEA